MTVKNHDTPNKSNSFKDQRQRAAYFNDSVGKTLQRRRIELGLSLEDIAKETKIQRRYLVAIEASNWKKIPHTVHVLGFVRTYANILRLDDGIAATKYLLERGPLIEDPKPARKTKVKNAVIGSRVFIGVIIGIAILVVTGYLILQLSILAAPPSLILSNPDSDQQTQARNLEVTGSTVPRASVSVNGTPVVVDDEGNFTANLTLNEGLNTITVEARNQAGKQSRVERTIIVTP